MTEGVRNKILERNTDSFWRYNWEKGLDISKEIDYHLLTRKPFYELLNRSITKHLDSSAALKILELGCGTAIDSCLLGSMNRVSIICIDLSYSALKLARQIAQKFSRTPAFFNCDINKVCFKDNSFDIIFSQGVIEHFRDASYVIKEQVRLLKDNGILVVDVPQTYTAYTIFKHRKIRKSLWPYGWETQFSYRDLVLLGEKYGLEVIDFCGHQHDSTIRIFNLNFIRNIVKRLNKINPWQKARFFSGIERAYDKLWNSLERKWGHYFLLNIAVAFRKKTDRKSLPKICMISASFPYMHCGIGDYTAQLANSLKNLNLDLTVITSSNKKIEERIKFFQDKGINVLPLIKGWGFLDIITLIKKISDLKPEIVHIQYQWWMYHKKAMITLMPFFLKILKRNYFIVTTFHDLMGPYLFPKAGSLRNLGIKALSIFSDKIITTNKKETDKLLRLAPSVSGKIAHIPTGPGIFLDSDQKFDVNRLRTELRDEENQILISNFGFMLPFKGLEDLLQAMKILLERNYSVKLLAIGGFDIEIKASSVYFSKIQKMAENLDINNHINWLGHCNPDQVSSYLLASDICVLPYADGVSERRTSFISVLSHGVPIVTTKGDNTPEKLIDHENIILVNTKSPVKLADAIEELIKYPELRKKLGNSARKLYEERYSWNNIASDTLKVYGDRINEKINC